MRAAVRQPLDIVPRNEIHVSLAAREETRELPSLLDPVPQAAILEVTRGDLLGPEAITVQPL